jgi:hypothetical protein
MERMVALGAAVNKKNKENYTALHFGTGNSLRIFKIIVAITEHIVSQEYI